MSYRKYIAYLVGIDEYEHNIPSLSTPSRDAKRLGKVLEEYYEYETHLYTENISQQNFESLLEEIAEGKTEEIEHIIFYFAGHGLAKDSQEGQLEGYLLPSDAKAADTFSFISMGDLYEALKYRSPHHLLVIMDCCFSGAFRWSSGLRKSTQVLKNISQEQFQYFLQHKSWQVITSASYDEAALDIISGDKARGEKNQGTHLNGHSPFAYALIEGLCGKADIIPPEGDGVITVTELFVYLQNQFLNEVRPTGHIQMPGQWPLDLHHKGQYIFQIQKKLDLPTAPELVAANNPYRGLEAYERDQANLFFGRKKALEDLVKKVQHQSLIAVVGASGSGKSSLVKAGVVAALTDHPDWIILETMRPGNHPFENLKTILKEFATYKQGFDGLREFHHAHKGKQILWIIDQFEELITETINTSLRNDFLAQLKQASAELENLHILLTLRADFEPQFPKLLNEDNWGKIRYIIPKMGRKNLRAAILGPAEARSIFFDPFELVDEMIEEVADAPGSLPLLSFALSELYLAISRKGDKKRTITAKDYEELGGVVGALRFRADRVYESLPNENSQEMMKNLMLRMVSVEGGELARRRMYLSEVIFEDEKQNQKAKEVIARLQTARLLVSDQDSSGKAFVEPAHDELIRGWSSLLSWLEEFSPSKLMLMREITRATADWEESGRKSGLLWTHNPRLEETRDIIVKKKWWKFWDKG